MLVKKKSICIVVSTLPVGFMVSQFESLHIKKIIVTSQVLKYSFQGIKEKYPFIEIVQAPSGFIMQAFYFITQLLTAKLGRNSVIVFHECCMPILDLLLKLIRPVGYYFPQVTMSGWENIKFDEFPKQKLTFFLKTFGLVSYFKYYRSSAIGGNEPEYSLSIKSYPSNIVTKDVKFSREKISEHFLTSHIKRKKILFITGKSYASNSAQINVYRNLIDCAYSKGYTCHIKDHPNPIYRLDLSIDCAINIDPVVPVELLERDYHLVVGVSSTSLLAFHEQSISIINLFDDISSEDRVSCEKHFNNADPENKIKYINSKDEFTNFL